MRIVLPYCPDVPHGFYWDFFQGLSDAIEARGDEAVRFPFAKAGSHDAGEFSAFYRLLGQGCDLLVDLCCWGYGLTRIGVQQAGAPPLPVLDALDIPYVGMLFDQPYFQPINAVVARRLFATFPDLGHREQAEFVFPGFALAGDAFVPPAVRPANARFALDWRERDIDVLYVGNLDPAALARPWRGGALEALGEAVAQMVHAQPERPFLRGVAEVLERQAVRPAPQELADLVRMMELYVRSSFRRDVVLALARSGLRIRVVGRGWDTIALPESAERVAPIAYEQIFRLAGRSRICVDASTYLSGANDRVFNYALNGAVCATNATGYLQPAMGEEEWLYFYSLRELDALAERLHALLADPRRLRETGECAQRAVLARHTWRERLETILATCSSSSPSPRVP